MLFVLIDTLRAEPPAHLRLRARRPVPFLDLLASQGVRFARHLSQSSWTKCSMASLWTGLYPQRTGVTRFDDVLPPEARDAGRGLPRRRLPHRGHLAQRLGRGLFRLRPGLRRLHAPASAAAMPAERPARESDARRTAAPTWTPSRPRVEFLRVYGRERWFLYLHLMDVHEYTYDDEQRAVRHQLRRRLRQRGAPRESGARRAVRRALPRRLPRQHAARSSRPTTARRSASAASRATRATSTPRSPRCRSCSGSRSGSRSRRSCTQRTANVDLWPTVLDLLGLPPLENVDGRSRVPEILAAARGEPGPDDDATAIAHLDQTLGPARRHHVAERRGEPSAASATSSSATPNGEVARRALRRGSAIRASWRTGSRPSPR